jgi:hypothetical protein
MAGASIDRQAEEQADAGQDRLGGARYRAAAPSDSDDREGVEKETCKNCGRDLAASDQVDVEVLRVFGDRFRRLPVCDDCIETRGSRNEHYATVSAAIAAWRRERGGI